MLNTSENQQSRTSVDLLKSVHKKTSFNYVE